MRQSDFFRLWLVGCSAFVVRWLEMLAVGLYAYQVTSSAFVVAMLSMLRLLPMGLFGALLGALSDRVERRSAIIVIVIVSMLGTGSLAVLASFDAVQVWHLALASFVNGICWAADNPFRRMTIGDVVGPERMGKAMAIDAGTNNASRVVGPLISGVLLGYAGIASVFWLGVVLYVPSLWAALRIRVRSRKHAADRKEGILTSIAQGIVWMRSDRRVVGVFLVTIYFNIFGWPCSSMIPVIGTDYMRLDPSGVGMMASAGEAPLAGARLCGGGGRLLHYPDGVCLCAQWHRGCAGVAVYRYAGRLVRHHAIDARISVHAERDAGAVARSALDVHRDEPDRILLPRLAGRDARSAQWRRGARGAGRAGDAAHASVVEGGAGRLSWFQRGGVR
jgi:MFS family permease